MTTPGGSEFERGHEGELRIERALMRRHWWVVRSYDYSGSDDNKAPRMYSLNHEREVGLVIPDLDVSRAGQRYWIEVKVKAKPLHYRKFDRLEHGISRRHYEAYKRVQRESGSPVWIAVYEEDTGAALIQSLDWLAISGFRDGPMKKGGASTEWMINFPRGAFDVFPDWEA